MATCTLDNWDGHEVKSPSLPERFKDEAAKHLDAIWFICEGEFEVDHESGCDWGDPSKDNYGSGPWSHTTSTPNTKHEAWLKAALLDDDGEDMMEIELFGNEAIHFIGWDTLVKEAEGGAA